MYNKVLVTGANGMLGQDLCPIFEENQYNVVRTDDSDLDITNIDSVESSILHNKPDIVVHCAAYTNVDKAEEEYDSAYKINVKGTENVAKICAQNDITLVYISTDYVFDGKNLSSSTPYKPTDKANPLNNYGLTKFQGEEAVRKFCKKYYIVRTAWLYGIHGKNFVETMIALAGVKPELKVVDDQIGCPTWTVDLSKGILKLLNGKAYGTYHICGGGQTSWYGFAKTIFEIAGLKVNLLPCTTDEYLRPANRPKYSVMHNGGLCRPWQDGLKDYLKSR